jgi:hypothetical protein
MAWYDALPDLDNALAYRTGKVAVIKDRFLGALWLIGLLGVFVYFVVVRLVIDQAHYLRQPVEAIVETSLRAPAFLLAEGNTSYCEAGLADAPQVLPCDTGPDAWVFAPSTGNEELFIATRLEESFAAAAQATTSRKVFVRDVEHYTVGLSFSIHASHEPQHAKSIREIQTRLLGQDGLPISSALHRISRFDVVDVRTLLRAAGVLGLDVATCQGTDGACSRGGSRSLRYNGLVLSVLIDCTMDTAGSISQCDYRVTRMPWQRSKIYLAMGDDTRNIQERNGIKIVVSCSGELGVFRWSSVLMAWVSSCGMIGMVTILIDFLMKHCMGEREVYKLLKWEYSVDFSDYRQGDQKTVAAV